MPIKEKNPLAALTKAQTEALYKGFKITSVARADLVDAGFPLDAVLKIDDGQMQYLAEKMAGAYTGGDTFWIDLDILADDLLGLKKVDE